MSGVNTLRLCANILPFEHSKLSSFGTGYYLKVIRTLIENSNQMLDIPKRHSF